MSTDGSGSVRSLVAGFGLGRTVPIDRFRSTNSGTCSCRVTFEDDVLTLRTDDCDDGETLFDSPSCRRTVVERLADRGADGICVRSRGLEHRYDDAAVRLLASAGRFVDLLGDRNERLTREAKRDPLAVGTELKNRVGPVADVGYESGLSQIASEIDSYDELRPNVGPGIGDYYLDRRSPANGTLSDVTELETGTVARIYDRPDSVPLYVLDTVDLSLSTEERHLLVDGYEAIATGVVDGERAASRAIERVSDGAVEPLLTAILSKHTDGYGVLEDLFSDPRITDVYATSPVARNPLRVVVDGQSATTNVELTQTGVESLASRVRRTSGRAFSRATPTVDATAELNVGTSVRIAGVTDPVANGTAFAFRERADDRFTLPALVENGTTSAETAAVLSIAVERNGAGLIAGTRGSGKTTLLGTLLYELRPDTRTVVIEDTPELPVGALQSVDRDVQALRAGTGDGPEISPADSLRTALRLGDGALVVGEVRGEEAQVLYEAMRVGANANAVLGTIHGDGADDVYERVVSDLSVEPSAFAATDFVVTVQSYRTPRGRSRRIARIEEVVGRGADVRFESLFDLGGDRATSTGRIGRGESRLVDRLAGPSETYADVRAAIAEREELLEQLANDRRTSPPEVAAAYADRGRVTWT
ncbi:type II/IV secretion system ATPase subunit [Natrarchaeobius oligotrophus]|uniref:Type II secretion protein n=1 Tax=Natrarchaeobius chitinivorans TaxID=1679083 RepID=A0A3N6NNW4_NATCH|nr:type II/IV secretion system ATPase subunit [Natrarchaeobius chitinivorans]RQH01293.1 type II secretion protein [Natrarchaeobius chitinivorans]